ncbi:MAG TPA: hypothetical protein VI796_04820, partial [Candidatus Thermoplasmatota archaeon]|nr:hypothetical protein [Candidatus Thermoplasmatota archaeon]
MIRQLPKIVMAPAPRQSADLGQDIFRHWGVHMKAAAVWLNVHLGKHPNTPVGEPTDKWLTSLGQLAAEAARLHPKPFAAFCEAFVAG